MSLLQIAAFILIIALVGALLEKTSAEWFVQFLSSEKYKGQWLPSIAASLIVLPSLTHYILDAYIWRKKHPEFSRVLQAMKQN